MSGSDTGVAGLECAEQWRRVNDSTYFECMYRFTEDGQVEVLALGARVVVPINALSLLPEPIARAVLAEWAERAASELRAAAKSAPVEQQR